MVEEEMVEEEEEVVEKVEEAAEEVLRAVRLQFGASSKEYMAATELMQEVAQVPKQESRSASGSIL